MLVTLKGIVTVVRLVHPANAKGPIVVTLLYALYGIQKKQIPDEHSINWENDSPFGRWLTEKFGSQKGLWSKAAWCAAQVYAGRPPFGISGIDKRQIWGLVAGTPDKDAFVLDKLRAIQ